MLVLSEEDFCLKSTTRNKNPIYKARYAMQGYKDLEKDIPVDESTTANQSSIRMLISMAEFLGFIIWSEDISQA